MKEDKGTLKKKNQQLPACFDQNLVDDYWKTAHFDICLVERIVLKKNTFFKARCEHRGIDICLGTSNWNIRNDQFQLGGENILIYNSNEKHQIIHNGNFITDVFTLHIHEGYVKKFFEEFDINIDNIVFENIEFSFDDRIKGIINTLLKLPYIPQASRIIYDCLVTELLLFISLQCKNTSSLKINRYANTGHFPSNFNKAKKVIRELAFWEELNLERIAELCGLSKFHFLRNFKKNVGLSPIKYLNKVKMDFAKEKLLSSSESILDISCNLGIVDISTFNRSFKKETGLTPSQYRKEFSDIRC